jgi:hypothetical protein
MNYSVLAQSLVEDATKPLEIETTPGLFTETIKIISGSRKIFILSNNNQQLGVGDFISLIYQDKMALRAVVAKTHQGQAGIKILKIYSLSTWSKLTKNLDVQILRGDDSGFGKKVEKEIVTEASDEKPKIETEDDLFNSKGIEEIGDLNDSNNRHIKPDNIVSAMLGTFTAQNTAGDRVGDFGNQFAASWGYQFTDNYFTEFYFSSVMLKDFPSGAGSGGTAGISTRVNTTSVRLKYNIKAPLYSFIMPYVGFRFSEVLSPNAGEASAPDPEAEKKRIDELRKSGLVFGVTLLRRLVPGWFVKLDFGTDSGLNVGVAIEF